MLESEVRLNQIVELLFVNSLLLTKPDTLCSGCIPLLYNLIAPQDISIMVNMHTPHSLAPEDNLG